MFQPRLLSSKSPEDNLYSRPGPHMWSLLFQEREHEFSAGWHAWHFALACIGPLAAWWTLSGVRQQMQCQNLALQLVEAAMEGREEEREAEEKNRVLDLAKQVVQLREDVEALRHVMRKQP